MRPLWRSADDLRRLILRFAEENKPIAAICAAPMVLGKLGLLKGKKATCYPGFEQYLEGADCTGAMVEKDGNVITGKGPALPWSLLWRWWNCCRARIKLPN